jgi:hypothetical protein
MNIEFAAFSDCEHEAVTPARALTRVACFFATCAALANVTGRDKLKEQ